MNIRNIFKFKYNLGRAAEDLSRKPVADEPIPEGHSRHIGSTHESANDILADIAHIEELKKERDRLRAQLEVARGAMQGLHVMWANEGQCTSRCERTCLALDNIRKIEKGKG